MLGDLDMLQCAQKDAPTMRRLSVELGAGQQQAMQQQHMQHPASATTSPMGRDIPGGGALRRLSTSSVASSTGRSSMSSTDSGASISPTFSSSLPNSFYLERVSNLLGRASSLPLDRMAPPCGSPASAAPSLPTIPAGAGARSPMAAAARPLAGSGGSGGGDPTAATRVSSLIRSLSKGMNNFN